MNLLKCLILLYYSSLWYYYGLLTRCWSTFFNGIQMVLSRYFSLAPFAVRKNGGRVPSIINEWIVHNTNEMTTVKRIMTVMSANTNVPIIRISKQCKWFLGQLNCTLLPHENDVKISIIRVTSNICQFYGQCKALH